MSTKIFSVDSIKVQTIVTMGIDNGMTEDAILSYVKKGFSGFDTVKLFDGSTKDIASLVYSDLLDESAQTDILIRKYTQSAEYVAYKAAWDALDNARNALVSIIDPDSGIGVRGMSDPDLFISSPGGGGRRAYDYRVGQVYNSATVAEWGIEVLEFIPVLNKEKEQLIDKNTNQPVMFVNRCRVVSTKENAPKPRAKEFSSLSSAVAYVQKRWAQSPATTTPGKDGDALTTGLNCPKWLGIPLLPKK